MRSFQTVDPEQHWTEAITAHEAGDLMRARRLYGDVLRAQPHDADALHMLGLIAQQFGDLGQARALLEESVSVCADSGRTHYDLAIIRAAQGDVSGAVLAYEAAVTFAPDFADAHSNLGSLYLQSGRREDALRAFAAALRANPDLAVVHCNLATVLLALERYDEAIAAAEAALRLAPVLAEAHANLYQAYRRSGRISEALAALAAALRAIDLQPDAISYVNLGAIALEDDVLDLAIAANRRALDIDPARFEVHYNLGRVYHLSGRYAESIAAGATAIAVRPDCAEAHLNFALSLLVCGDFARGWDEYDWLWRMPERRAENLYLDRVPLWNGEAFAGQLLITRDQGFGDAIQMVRYVPAIKARGGRVILEADTSLVPLFAGLPGVDELHVASDVAILADVDLHIPPLGIPRAFATDLTLIPAPIPYLHALPERFERWRPRLQRPAPLRVGIVWAGNPSHANDHRRSVRLEDFAALADIEDIAWFGLQKGHDEERRSCGLLQIDPLGAEMDDFADTAAILVQLDLTIAVDTSIVHLAGALGRPVWTLLPFAADWRWLLARDDSPWYPSMRLFRQPHPGDWTSVFAQVARELRALRIAR